MKLNSSGYNPDQQETAREPRRARYWKNQIESALAREKKWRDRSEKVFKRYLDDRDGDTLGLRSDDQSRVNMLWSNTEVLKSVLFANLGKPDVNRAFPKTGRDNQVARTAALILERCLDACSQRYDPETEIEDSVTDYLLSGRGQAWIELSADIEVDKDENQDSDDDSPKPDDADDVDLGGYSDGRQFGSNMRVANQQIEICHVPYEDWTHGPGRKWEQVPWAARKHLMDKEDLEEHFGAKVAEEVPMSFTLKEGLECENSQDQEDFKRAKVWEIWDKKSKCRIYIADGYQFELERMPDPYKLEGFFPCPKPLYSVKVPGSLIPKPEYLQYQDQCDELDRINTRIKHNIEALKMCGVYDATSDEDGILKNLGMLDDGEFLPYKGFKNLAAGGGLAAAFQLRDTAPYAQAIQVLAERGSEILQIIYEVTGISDIVRGATDPRETAAAQLIKSRFGTQRIQKRQKDVQRFVGDLYKMKGELIAEHFQREQLAEMSGIDIPTKADQMQAQMVVMLARMQQAQQAAAMQGQSQPMQQAA